MLAAPGPITSEQLAEMMRSNPVVVRRVMAGLRVEGLVASAKGHGGGWVVARDPATVTLADIHRAVGEPTILAIGHRTERPTCLVEQAVNGALGTAFRDAEAVFQRHLDAVTLAELSADFNARLARRGETIAEQTHAL